MTLLYSSINEQPLDVIDVRERGLAYGDGHFTTATIVDGKIQLLQAHLTRLQLAQSRLKLQPIDWLSLTAHAEQVASAFSYAVIKIVITAGSGGRGYSRVGAEHPNVFVTISEFPAHYLTWQEEGIELGLADFTLSSHSILSGLKHLNRLEQVMIRAELDERAEQELIVCDSQRHIIEASCANVFWLKEERWYTPSLESCGVDGIMRQMLISQLSDIQVGQYPTNTLVDIDAMMLTNSVMGIVPVNKYLNKSIDISAIREVQKMVSV
jgi:4-amino-4-deoxychorismate lyase